MLIDCWWDKKNQALSARLKLRSIFFPRTLWFFICDFTDYLSIVSEMSLICHLYLEELYQTPATTFQQFLVNEYCNASNKCLGHVLIFFLGGGAFINFFHMLCIWETPKIVIVLFLCKHGKNWGLFPIQSLIQNCIWQPRTTNQLVLLQSTDYLEQFT